MKLQHITADNFLRLNLFDIDLTDDVVHLFAGPNEAGKTSVQEAIRFAFLGETVRVTKKGDYKLMIRDGAKAGTVSVDINDYNYQRDIKTGKLIDERLPPRGIEYVLDAQRFASLNLDKRRGFLIQLTDTAVKPEDIKRRMLAKGVDEDLIDMVMPMLKSGFTATHKEAQRRATEARSRWCGLTGNSRYGSQIAAKWKASPPDGVEPAEVRERLIDIEANLEDLNKQQQKLTMDKGSLSNQIDMAKDKRPCACAHCGGLLRIEIGRNNNGKLETNSFKWSDTDEIDVGGLRSSILSASNEIQRIQIKMGELAYERTTLNANLALVTEHAAITERAQQYHEDVKRWEKSVDVLAPDGIPAEILSDALTPVNDHLRETALQTGWPQISISPTMDILADNRLYQLLSESARWRADVALAEAISYLSGLRLLVIDRMDVLDLKNRQAFMQWIHGIMDVYDSILIFATLKAKPSLPSIKSHWIVNGEILETEKKEVAA